ADRKAYDLLVQCETGLVSITGWPDAPAKVGISVADIAAGMYAFTGVLTALYRRERTGQGSALAVSLLDALSEWMSAPALMAAGSGRAPMPVGLAHATIAPYGPYPAADGQVMIAVQNEREFVRLATDALDRPQLADDERFADNSARVRNRDALNEEIASVTRMLTSRELVERLDAAAIANARVRGVGDLIDHPQLRARHRWRPVNTPGGTVESLAGAVSFADFQPAMGSVPALGEHTERVLRELGVDPELLGRQHDATPTRLDSQHR
ncbi:MAG: CaiB/BaiF CoA transferase family protein, partial [Nocardioidaceae bacterium]